METKNISLEKIISNAVKLPGVKVNRDVFLARAFAKPEGNAAEIIAKGPVKAGISREKLANIANSLILDRTGKSSVISFAAGIPGWFSAAVSVPADVLQFFGMNLRLAQELSYLYGARDLWQNGEIDNERVINQLILYSGVMFGAEGAEAGVRLTAGPVAQTALLETYYEPLLKQICRDVGVSMSKKLLNSGVAKMIPLIGGIFAGGTNFGAMMRMARKLQYTLDTACFEYTESDMEADIAELSNIDDTENKAEEEFREKKESIKEKISTGVKNISSMINKDNKDAEKEAEENIFNKLSRLAELRDAGVISREEFEAKKAELLSRI